MFYTSGHLHLSTAEVCRCRVTRAPHNLWGTYRSTTNYRGKLQRFTPTFLDPEAKSRSRPRCVSVPHPESTPIFSHRPRTLFSATCDKSLELRVVPIPAKPSPPPWDCTDQSQTINRIIHLSYYFSLSFLLFFPVCAALCRWQRGLSLPLRTLPAVTTRSISRAEAHHAKRA